MGISQRNNEIQSKMLQMQCSREDYAGRLGSRSAIQCKAFGQAQHMVLADDCCCNYCEAPVASIACDSGGSIIDLDLRVKPRDPDASIRVAQWAWADTHYGFSAVSVDLITSSASRCPLCDIAIISSVAM